MIQDTSFDSFLAVRKTITPRQQAVMRCLKVYPELTNGEIAKLLERPINTITPRVHELRQLGLLEDAGRRRCRVTHSMAHAWRIKPLPSPAKQEQITQLQLT